MVVATRPSHENLANNDRGLSVVERSLLLTSEKAKLDYEGNIKVTNFNR
jgi:hypothetical protein